MGNKNTPHFGAKGHYFSFGLKSLYKIQNNSSIGSYGMIQSKSEAKNIELRKISKIMEDKFISTLNASIIFHCHHFPNMNNLLSPTADVACTMQDDIGDINIKFNSFAEIHLKAQLFALRF